MHWFALWNCVYNLVLKFVNYKLLHFIELVSLNFLTIMVLKFCQFYEGRTNFIWCHIETLNCININFRGLNQYRLSLLELNRRFTPSFSFLEHKHIIMASYACVDECKIKYWCLPDFASIKITRLTIYSDSIRIIWGSSSSEKFLIDISGIILPPFS